jgi:cysteine synthase
MYVTSMLAEGSAPLTRVEIGEDTRGAVDVFVSAVGTGGTVTGVGRALKERKPSVRALHDPEK